MSDPQHDANLVLDLLRACETFSEAAGTDAFVSAAQPFQARAKSDPTLVRELAPALESLPLEGGAILAILLGALVEGGADPELSWPHLLARYRALPEALARDVDAPPDGDAVPPAIVDAVEKFSRSMVAHLARMPAMRESLAHDEAFSDCLSALEAAGAGAFWVREALSLSSGQLVVLHVDSARGFIVEYRNIANCFHLFSLLQRAIGARLPGGRSYSPPLSTSVNRFASGQTECAWWHYGHAASPTADLVASIWGEAPPASIPVVDGRQVLLLWPPILNSRSWDRGFFGYGIEAMPAEVLIEAPLSDEAARGWLDRLGIERPRKRWWSWRR